jgi:hypothetical protein
VQRAAYALRTGSPIPAHLRQGFCRTGYQRMAGYVINDYG